TAEDLAEQGDLVDRGTPAAQRGKAIGLILGGTYTMVSGAGGEILGGAATATGVGAAVGVPAIVVSTGMVLGGAANVYTGVQSLMAGPKDAVPPSASPGNATSDGTAASPGKRTFSKTDRAAGLEKAKDANGVPRCEYCGKEIDPKAGAPTSYEADHRLPHSRGGPSTPENLAPACRTCNRSKGAKMPEEWKP
ncbi:MAG: HNH endonuclease signature motif containing protein, partial [Polyangiaceae bacterium]